MGWSCFCSVAKRVARRPRKKCLLKSKVTMEFIQQFQKDDWTVRLSKAQQLRKKHTDRIPIILDRGNTQTPKPSGHRFLVPITIKEHTTGSALSTVGHLLKIIRSNIPQLTPEQAIFLFVNNTAPALTLPLNQLYMDQQDRDGFLYIVYSVETTFGEKLSSP